LLIFKIWHGIGATAMVVKLNCW